ncbi:hypothetical protein [Parasitella parasitica]|uniref:Helitron helicase-like domain-containing protein n=1 Tax=Parasitella parasitica TaxID=35722 RepID=A0A0B7N7U3_9FUNG|nr:hypothetical protein [Parasitella parasitica]
MEEDMPMHRIDHGQRKSKLKRLRLAPGEGKTPLSILRDEDIDYLAFPKIFYGHKLATTASYADRYRSFAKRLYRRCVERPDFLMFMDKKLQYHKLTNNVRTILRKTKSPATGRPYIVSQVMNENITNLLSEDQAYKVFHGVCSSAEYWRQEKKNLMAMIRQLGIPTFFLTLSAAETKWNELPVQLKQIVDKVEISEHEAEALTIAEKRRLIQADPVTYYQRPNYTNATTEAEIDLLDRQVADFIDTIITCSRDWDGSPHHINPRDSNEETWTELLKRQTHKHTATCRRKRGSQTVCRFNIPFLPMSATKILRPLNLETDSQITE